jgi:hypothetical protein
MGGVLQDVAYLFALPDLMPDLMVEMAGPGDAGRQHHGAARDQSRLRIASAAIAK